MILRDGWKYFILAACDVEGNFLVVKAYQYTDLLSCMLLDAWAIPVCLFFSWLYLRIRYHWTQILVSMSDSSEFDTRLNSMHRVYSFASEDLACSSLRNSSPTRTGIPYPEGKETHS